MAQGALRGWYCWADVVFGNCLLYAGRRWVRKGAIAVVPSMLWDQRHCIRGGGELCHCGWCRACAAHAVGSQTVTDLQLRPWSMGSIQDDV